MRNPKFYLNSRLSGLVTRICYASMHKQSGPVAQRLEQGTHNLNRAVLLVLAMWRLGWFS
jgi:hypothetical protein